MSKSGLKTIADEDREEKFGFVFAVSGPGMYIIQYATFITYIAYYLCPKIKQ